MIFFWNSVFLLPVFLNFSRENGPSKIPLSTVVALEAAVTLLHVLEVIL